MGFVVLAYTYMYSYLCVIIMFDTFLTVNFVCGNQTYYAERGGEIVSHYGYYFGEYHGKNLNCIWRIEAPEGMMVILYAETFDLDTPFVR